MSNEHTENYIRRYKDARDEAKRFIKRADAAILALEASDRFSFDTTKTAAAKRASMDLSRALSAVRKGLWDNG